MPWGAGHVMDQRTRLALVLSGGASLGAYTAGVVTELLEALTADSGSGLTLDVIVGSSAGAVNAALAARAMTVNPELLPFLRKTWVEALDATTLLDPDRPDRAGVLDASAIEELSRALITAEPASDDRPMGGVGNRLRLGITLSNLTGVPYESRYSFRNAPGRPGGIRVHRDAVSFELEAPVPARDPVWEEVRRSAVASAAFPFAFPPVPLTRASSAYPGARLGDDVPGHEMWFTDGGLFANQPIGLAKRLVEGFADYRSSEWRFILVDPDLDVDASAPSPPTSIAGVAGALTRAVLGQAAAMDWARASETNARVAVFEALVDRLPELADGLCDPDALELGHQIGLLAERVAESEAERRGRTDDDGPPDALDEALSRIERDPRFAAVLARVRTRAARTRLAKLIYILEEASDLRDKQVLPLYLVSPESGERLAGDFLGGFGGFLSRDWRMHDFTAGRRDGARLLTRHFSDVLDYHGDPDIFRLSEPGPTTLAAAPAAVRGRLDAFIDRETDRVLRSIRPGPLVSALGWVWKPAVRRWVRRRVHETLARS